MSKGYTIAPWRPIAGSGQSLALTATTSQTFANALGAPTFGSETRAFEFKLAPAATAYYALVRISQAGTAATASTDYMVSSTDPPQIIGCSPGDKVAVYASATGTAFLCELTN